MNCKLIVLEGIDGVGKTTLSLLLKERLCAMGIPALRYEEREERATGFNIIKPFIKKEAPIDASLLFYLASAIYKSGKIQELLADHWVICDRYVYSTLAFHKVRGADLSIVDPARLPIIKPDYFFLIQVEESLRFKRMSLRADTTEEDMIPNVAGTIPWATEQALKEFHPVIIDNSFPDPGQALAAMLSSMELSLTVVP